MEIKLSKPELHRAECLGRDTVAVCKLMKFDPRLENDKQSRVDANILGYKAEIAVAKLYSLEYPILNIVSDGGLDLWIDQFSIDAKWTSTSDLIFDSMEKFESDFAVGVPSVSDDVMEVHGFVSRKKFKRSAVIKNYKYGDRLAMPLADLASPELLWKYAATEKFKPEETQ